MGRPEDFPPGRVALQIHQVMSVVRLVLHPAGGADGGEELAPDHVPEPGPLGLIVLLRPREGQEVFVQPVVFHPVSPRSSMIRSRRTAAYSNSSILLASFISFSRRLISASRSCLFSLRWWRARVVSSSAVVEISSTSRTPLMMVLGTMPCSWLKRS